MPQPVLVNKKYLVIRHDINTIAGTHDLLADAEAQAATLAVQTGVPVMVYNDESVFNPETPATEAVRYDLTTN